MPLNILDTNARKDACKDLELNKKKFNISDFTI